MTATRTEHRATHTTSTGPLHARVRTRARAVARARALAGRGLRPMVPVPHPTDPVRRGGTEGEWLPPFATRAACAPVGGSPVPMIFVALGTRTTARSSNRVRGV